MENPFGPLVDQFKVSQSVTPDAKSVVESVYIKFGTFCRENKSCVCVTVSSGSKTIQSWMIDSYKLSDNVYQEFSFDEEIEISSCPPDWNIEILCTAINADDGVALFYDDEKVNDSFYVGYKQVKGSLCLDLKSKPIIDDFDCNCAEKNGLISVVIPSYNCSEFLERCIQSVLSQTYNNTEIFIVDDGSEINNVEKTRSIVSKLKKNSSLISLIEFPKNKGAPAARNAGAELAGGEFIFFLDADTFLDKKAFEAMIDSLHSHPECSYAYCDFKWGEKIISGSPFGKERIKRCNLASMMSLLRLADLPEGGLDESLPRYQDWDLWLTLLKDDKIGIWTGGCLFETIVRENSISSGGSISDQEARKMLAKKHSSWADIKIL